MENLRQKITNIEKKLGNFFYDGLGDVLTTEVNTKELTALLAAGIIGFTVASCATRPYAKGGENYENLTHEIRLDEVTKKNSRFYAKGVSIFDENFYHAVTPIGEVLFKDSKSLENITYELDKKGKIKGSTSIESGEGGLYFIDHARNKEGKMIDEVYISSFYKKAIMSSPKILEQKESWGLFDRIEKDSKFNAGTGYLSGKPYFAVEVENKKIDLNEKNFYNFYLIPVKNSQIQINEKGHLKIKNNDNIFRPIFASWETISRMIKENKKGLSQKEQKITEEILESVGFKAIKTEESTKQ